MTNVTLQPPLANHCSRARHTARECPWPECTDGFTARLAEAIESVNNVMLLTLGRLQAFFFIFFIFFKSKIYSAVLGRSPHARYPRIQSATPYV